MACLIGDIGGTHARFAISTSEGKIECMRICQNSAYSSLLNSVQDYLKDPALKSLPRANKAALAIAAPLSGDEVILTNRDWSFSRERLQADLGIQDRPVQRFFGGGPGGSLSPSRRQVGIRR